jgi:low affinity Fe/Cu permease
MNSPNHKGDHSHDRPSAGQLGAMPKSTSSVYAERSAIAHAFDHFANYVTRWAGSPAAFCLSLAAVLVWACLGPLFHYSENWQLVVNTATTIITFLMVFLIQQSQNKDSIAVHLKLNELLASSKAASNRMIGIEDLDEQDLREVAEFYVKLAEMSKMGVLKKQANSIDDDDANKRA